MNAAQKTEFEVIEDGRCPNSNHLLFKLKFFKDGVVVESKCYQCNAFVRRIIRRSELCQEKP